MTSPRLSTIERGARMGVPPLAPIRRALHRIAISARKKPLGAVGAAMLLVFALIAVFAPVVAPHDPHTFIAGERLSSPSLAHPFGTDAQSRDVLSRVIFGTRLSLSIAVLAVSLTVVLGTAIGLISGYLGGKVDAVIQRLVDVLLAFPLLILLIALVAMLGQSVTNIVVALAIGRLPGFIRVVRGVTLSLRNELYVEAARALGASPARVMFRHLLPNTVATILVIATSAIGGVILAETSLSFLGLGPPVAVPSWGKMLSGDARVFMNAAPWLGIFPGLAITVVVFSANMLGDALRDLLDPRLRSR